MIFKIKSNQKLMVILKRLRRRGFDSVLRDGVYTFNLENESFFFYVGMMSSLTSGGGWKKIELYQNGESCVVHLEFSIRPTLLILLYILIVGISLQLFVLQIDDYLSSSLIVVGLVFLFFMGIHIFYFLYFYLIFKKLF